MSTPDTFDTTPLPEPLIKGRFSLYHTPDGGYHLAYVLEGEDETRHMAIPGMAVKMAEKMAGTKNPFGAMLGGL